MDPERARERLAEERARIEQQLGEHEQPDTSDEVEDSGDEADDLDRAGTDEAFLEQLRRNLDEIERAEQRLENGTYGKSVVSGDPIPDERLEAIPWADRNVDEEPGARGT
jgi:RNA polymerase-binding transcription factor